MPQEIFKPKGQLKAGKPDAGGAGIFSAPVFGVVKDNIDPNRAGRIKVFVTQIGAKDPDDSSNWLTVSYLSSFFGSVQSSSGQDSYGKFSTNPSSYGQWQSPPDIGSIVLCVFVNGDPNYGFYLGGVPSAETLQMVPAIGALDNIVPNGGEANSYGGATRLPVTNMNTNDKNKTDSNDFLNTSRPIHSYSAAVMFKQGILRDPVRGPISSSASREPASRVGWGVSTPGRPIYEGGYTDETLTQNLEETKSEKLKVISRRGGHSIVMDDGDIIGKDQLIRIRTALGHQIMMSDDGQTLMILHSNGQSYIELGKEGTVDIYSTNSFNVRTQGDLNFHADRNVNIHAQENLNIQAKSVHVNSEEDFKLRAGANISTYAISNFTSKADGTVSIAAGGEASVAAAGIAYVNGSKVNLNTGKCSTVPNAVPIITLNAQTDTLFDKEKGFIAAPAKLLSATSRTPAHAPWANAGQGVDVKVDLNASSQLPQEPTADVQTLNQEAGDTPVPPPEMATVASVPPTNPISKAMDAGTTNAIIGASATEAAVMSPAAVKRGASIASTRQQVAPAVGSYGLSPRQMEQCGILKPGASRLVNAMAGSTRSITRSMPSSMFTGRGGANNLLNVAANVAIQTVASSVLSRKAQTVLTRSGIISGRETSSQIAGLVVSVVKNGLGDTRNSLTNRPALPSTNVLRSISMGQSAVGLALKMGGLGGIQSALSLSGISLSSLSIQTRGISGAAFTAIRSSFKPLRPNVPQNLTQIAKQAATQAVIKAASTVTSQRSTEGLLNNIVRSTVKSAVPKIAASLVPSNPRLASTTANILLNSVLGVTGQNNGNRLSQISRPPPIRRTTADSFGINSRADSLTSLITQVAGQTLMTVAIKNATNRVSGMSGASHVIASGQLNQLPAAASVVQRGGGASLSSQLASGVNAIPGGINSLGLVTNNARNAVNRIPGTDIVSSQLGGNVDDLKAKYGNILDKSGSLSSLANTGLPSGEAAQLEAALSSCSSGTPGAFKMPAVAFNTCNNSEITAQVDTVIDDPKVPPPNFSGDISEDAVQSYQQLVEKEKQQTVMDEQKLQQLKEQVSQARAEYNKIYDESVDYLDPKLQEAEKRFIETSQEYEKALQEIRNRINT